MGYSGPTREHNPQAHLDMNRFLSLTDARRKIEAWRHDYNTYRPHSSLGDMTPVDFSKSTVRDDAQEARILTA